jgi:DNA replication protein DnaC
MSLSQLRKMNPTTPISELLKQIQKITPPGMIEKPEKKNPDANPECRKCSGFGYVKSEHFGTWFICVCVTEAHDQYLKKMQPRFDWSRIGIREDEAEMNWGYVKPGISDGIEAVKAIKPAYERGWGMIFLWGSYGQAKTLVGKILTATARRDGKQSAYANMSSVLDDIRLAFDERENKTTELLRRIEWWNQRDVLFIDEMDKCNDTPWAQERVFQLLDQRYMRAIREEALTVIASNRSDDELDGYLKSRLRDRRLGPVVYLNGNDARAVMPEQYKF